MIRVSKPEQAPRILRERGQADDRGQSAGVRGRPARVRLRQLALRREVGQERLDQGPARQVRVLRIPGPAHRSRRRRALPAQGRRSAKRRRSPGAAGLFLARLRLGESVLRLSALQSELQEEPVSARRPDQTRAQPSRRPRGRGADADPSGGRGAERVHRVSRGDRVPDRRRSRRACDDRGGRAEPRRAGRVPLRSSGAVQGASPRAAAVAGGQ